MMLTLIVLMIMMMMVVAIMMVMMMVMIPWEILSPLFSGIISDGIPDNTDDDVLTPSLLILELPLSLL